MNGCVEHKKKLFRYQVWWKERLLGENRLLVYKCLSLFELDWLR